jgi:hypothetical protein
VVIKERYRARRVKAHHAPSGFSFFAAPCDVKMRSSSASSGVARWRQRRPREGRNRTRDCRKVRQKVHKSVIRCTLGPGVMEFCF